MATPSSTADNTASNNTTNWQDSVPQQYRSDEISKIATELSALEPNTTATSKLGLASKFENAVFQSGSSLNDYHKRIQKRLKKLRKNYEKTNKAKGKAVGAGGAGGATPATGGDINGNEENDTVLEEKIIMQKRHLRLLHGDTMRLIASNGKIAAAKYPRLIDHIDKSNEYALEIGAIAPELAVRIVTGERIVLPKRALKDTLDYLMKLELNLEQKTTTLREWILKYSKEEKFFGEKLEQVEKNILLNTDKDYSNIFYQGLREALKSETTTTDPSATSSTSTSMVSVSNLANMTTPQLLQSIQTYQKKIRETVSIPRSKEDEKTASLIYIDKIRAASQICLLYILIPPQDMEAKLKLADTLPNANNTIFEAIKLLKETFHENNDDPDLIGNGNGKNGDSNKSAKSSTTAMMNGNNIKLEDAWNKVMEYDVPKVEESVNPDIITIDDDDSNNEPNVKRQKTTATISSPTATIQTKRLSIRTKILLVGGRKPPSNLVDALRRKRAIICHNHPTKGSSLSSMTFLKLQFGQAFEMFIYVSPLLVRIKAITDDAKLKRERRQKQQRHHATNSSSNTTAAARQYHAMGVSGDIDMIGPLIAKKLEYSSAYATRCLRRCFADLACRANSSDFETEILEGNALLKFLNMARNTYCPNWIDAELD